MKMKKIARFSALLMALLMIFGNLSIFAYSTYTLSLIHI